MLKILCFEKKTYICNTEKEQLKLTIMKKQIKNPMVQKNRITVIFKDEVIRVEFNIQILAMKTIKELKELYPEIYKRDSRKEKKKMGSYMDIII